MAIVTSCPKLKVNVSVKGVALEEYDDDEDEEAKPNTVTKYIEASSGESFAVTYIFAPGFSTKHHVEVRMYIDGKYADSSVFYNGCPLLRNYQYSFDGAREIENGQFFIRKFDFSQLDTNDSDLHSFGEHMKRQLKNVGTISISFEWVKASTIIPDISLSLNAKTLGVIPEKALKGSALSHQASYGDREAVTAFETLDTSAVEEGPFAVFKFKYRSRAALKSLLIIPRSPSPVPLEERNIDTLTFEETKELLRRQRKQNDASVLIKREGIKREGIKREGIKREGIKRKGIKGEGIKRERSDTVIDDDDDDDDDELSFVSAKRRRLPVTLNEGGAETIDLT